jgi:hypothetical protein
MLALMVLLGRYIHANEPEGAVLVMLPGWADISDIHALLTCGTEEYQRLVAGERKLPHERAGQQDRGGWYEVGVGRRVGTGCSPCLAGALQTSLKGSSLALHKVFKSLACMKRLVAFA